MLIAYYLLSRILTFYLLTRSPAFRKRCKINERDANPLCYCSFVPGITEVLFVGFVFIWIHEEVFQIKK
jgi:hypothetical protein